MANRKAARARARHQAKLEAVECGITPLVEEFLAHIVSPNGTGTVGDWLMPLIDKASESGKMPTLLPGWCFTPKAEIPDSPSRAPS